LLFLLPPLRVAFLPLRFEGFDLLFALGDFFPFRPLVALLLADEAFAFAVLPLFFAVRFPPFPRFFDAAEGFFLLRRFAAPPFDTAFALAATGLAFRSTGRAAELAEVAARRPAMAPITPPTTAPTGPATLPRTAPAAAPAVCLEIGGISMFSDDEPDVSDDGWFSSGITNALLYGNNLSWFILHDVLRTTSFIQPGRG
jgi:hypothetical protein